MDSAAGRQRQAGWKRRWRNERPLEIARRGLGQELVVDSRTDASRYQEGIRHDDDVWSSRDLTYDGVHSFRDDFRPVLVGITKMDGDAHPNLHCVTTRMQCVTIAEVAHQIARPANAMDAFPHVQWKALYPRSRGTRPGQPDPVRSIGGRPVGPHRVVRYAISIGDQQDAGQTLKGSPIARGNPVEHHPVHDHGALRVASQHDLLGRTCVQARPHERLGPTHAIVDPVEVSRPLRPVPGSRGNVPRGVSDTRCTPTAARRLQRRHEILIGIEHALAHT